MRDATTGTPSVSAQAIVRPVSTITARLVGLLANEWVAAALIFLLTRLLALIGGYAGISHLIAAEPTRNKGWVAELALMWDSAWYAGISQGGYHYDPAATGGTNIAFAPLYPFLMWLLSTFLGWLTPGWAWGNAQYGTTIAAGLIISNASFYLALVLLIKLLMPRLGVYRSALVALVLASLPLAFFFSTLYTEGLFLLLVVASLLVARSEWRHKWLCAGLLGMLASLDRLTGVIMLPVLAVEYLAQRKWKIKDISADAIWLALVPLGLAIYIGFLWWRFGSPRVLMVTQLKGWNHQFSFFLGTYWDSFAELWRSVTGQVSPQKDPVLYYGQGSRLYRLLDLGMPLLLLAGGFLAHKKVLLSEWALLVLGIVYPLSSNITFSMARYVLPLWPGFIWLGTLKRRAWWIIALWIAVSLALLVWCSSIFASAKWIG